MPRPHGSRAELRKARKRIKDAIVKSCCYESISLRSMAKRLRMPHNTLSRWLREEASVVVPERRGLKTWQWKRIGIKVWLKFASGRPPTATQVQAMVKGDWNITISRTTAWRMLKVWKRLWMESGIEIYSPRITKPSDNEEVFKNETDRWYARKDEKELLEYFHPSYIKKINEIRVAFSQLASRASGIATRGMRAERYLILKKRLSDPQFFRALDELLATRRTHQKE